MHAGVHLRVRIRMVHTRGNSWSARREAVFFPLHLMIRPECFLVAVRSIDQDWVTIVHAWALDPSG